MTFDCCCCCARALVSCISVVSIFTDATNGGDFIVVVVVVVVVEVSVIVVISVALLLFEDDIDLDDVDDDFEEEVLVVDIAFEVCDDALDIASSDANAARSAATTRF